MRHGFDCSQSFKSQSFKSQSIGSLSTFPTAHHDPLPAASVSGASVSGDQGISLSELFPAAEFSGDSDILVGEIAESAAVASVGELVVYRIGEDCPSRLVADAMARGAAGILTEQLLPCPLPQCVVGDVELALAEIRSRQLGHPDRKLLTVGVMGAAGKTSTTLLIASLLRASGIRTSYVCDLGGSDGVVQTTDDDALATGVRLVEHLSESVDAGSHAAIVEVSEEQARHGHYDSIQFDILIVTGAASRSGDFGPLGLQCLLERVTADGVVIAPSDDKRACQIIHEHECHVLTYGVGTLGDVAVNVLEHAGGMSTLLLTHQDTTAVMETALCGDAMAANHAAAATVGLLIALPLESIAERLGSLREIPGRGQRLSEYDRATVVVDAGGSPDRVLSSLQTCCSMKSNGRLWCVLAIDQATSAESLARYGSIMERFADHAVVTSRKEAQSAFLNDSHSLLDGVTKCAAFRLVANQKRAVEWAVEQASPADTVLVITSQTGQSARQQRSEIERLKRWLNPPCLKVFNG